MFNSFYGLSFNPFDKQQLKETDHFISKDFTEMTAGWTISRISVASACLRHAPGWENPTASDVLPKA